ncbi:MAG: exodeoxyribonuclease VII large subunit [Lachnospira sp.]
MFFTLKDEDSTISVVMYGSDAYKLDFRLKDGMSVVVDGRIDVYVNRGEYQLYAKTVSQSGMGELFKQYEQLKQYYEDMGYFSPEYKRTIPKYAKKIGIVTARTGAAIKDIIKNAYERNPYVELYLYSVLVQGKDAKYSIAKGLKYVDSMGYDCIIVGRGGGSIEDLWAFNEPEVIEAVFNCKTPVISAVGHEIDFTITDFVADFRAPTPSAAAVKAVFDIRQLEVVIDGYNDRLMYDMGKTITDYRNRSERMLLSLKAFNPLVRLNNKKQQLIHMREKLDVSMQGTLNKAKHRLLLLSARLDGVSPLKKLEQGYAFVENDKEEHISSISEVKQADVLSIHVKDGIINTVVKDVKKF